jgi:hypothetical protein
MKIILNDPDEGNLLVSDSGLTRIQFKCGFNPTIVQDTDRGPLTAEDREMWMLVTGAREFWEPTGSGRD